MKRYTEAEEEKDIQHQSAWHN
uniref:Uncharacterized protein n=1 Tax=Arundo donax TaxID=35708 RepID=A0A0A8YPG7_ARUDO